jgi:hypothetical protein
MFYWERQENESAKAYEAFCVYRDMGSQRSLAEVVRKYNKSVSLLGRWSSQWKWVERSVAYDREQDRIREEVKQAEIRKVLSQGFAQMHVRVKHLNKLARRQWRDMQSKDLIWLPDVKQIGGGEFAERVDLIRYNAALDQQFRETLGDIAAELGERVKKTELSGPKGGPVQVDDVTGLSNQERAERVNSLLDIARARRAGQTSSTTD